MSDCCDSSLSTGVLVGEEDRTEQKSIRTIALIGPPNCGKTTLFNQLTGLKKVQGVRFIAIRWSSCCNGGQSLDSCWTNAS